MLDSIIHIAVMIVWCLGIFIVAQIAQRIVVPVLVSVLDEKKFASPSAFDGCSLAIGAVVFSFPVLLILNMKGWPIAWTFPIVFLGCTLHGLVWLWSLGFGARTREWFIKYDKICGNENQVFEPTFVREWSDYNQTDAFNGYSYYFLELHDDQNTLATNAYNSEAEKNRDLAMIDQLLAPRRLDLILVWRSEDRKWATFPFYDPWALLLCSDLNSLNEEQRNWWRQWLLPRFHPDPEIKIDRKEWQRNLEALEQAYPDYWAEYTTGDFISEPGQDPRYETRPQTWNDKVRHLHWILQSATSDVFAMPDAQYEKTAKEAVGGYVQIMHSHDEPFVTLRPLYGEQKSKKEKNS